MVGCAERGEVAVAVVEDDPDVAMLLAEIVERAGYRPCVAHDGDAAIRLFTAACPPRVVILDLGLPVADGFAVAEAARMRLGGDLFIIAITGFADAAMQRRASDARFDLVLFKPFTVEAIETALSRASTSPAT